MGAREKVWEAVETGLIGEHGFTAPMLKEFRLVFNAGWDAHKKCVEAALERLGKNDNRQEEPIDMARP